MARIELQVPDEVSAEKDGFDLTVEGPNGTVRRRLWYPDVNVTVEDSVPSETERDGDGETVEVVVIESDNENAKTTATMGTFESHVENMFHGVTEGWEYQMEVYYSHFPMQVRADGGEVVIENFLGERAPRRTTIRGDTEVEIDGEELTLRGSDKEAVGQTAADIEQMTRVTDKDQRVFQDGVYITQKPGIGGA